MIRLQFRDGRTVEFHDAEVIESDRKPRSLFTPAEHLVVVAASHGLSNKGIQRALGIPNASTLQTHLRNALAKFKSPDNPAGPGIGGKRGLVRWVNSEAGRQHLAHVFYAAPRFVARQRQRLAAWQRRAPSSVAMTTIVTDLPKSA